MGTHAEKGARGERFEFGENWSRFLEALKDEDVLEARKSSRQEFEFGDLKKNFLGGGFGNGLLDLAARRSGARV